MFREELLHPAISHFPIALLVLLVLVKALQFFIHFKKAEYHNYFVFLSSFLLFTGSIFLIPTIFLGDMALDIVKPNMKNITLAYQHDELAHTTLYFFIAALLFEVAFYLKELKTKILIVLSLQFIIISIGNYYLFKTAHSGATLVYDYGTAVKQTP